MIKFQTQLQCPQRLFGQNKNEFKCYMLINGFLNILERFAPETNTMFYVIQNNCNN